MGKKNDTATPAPALAASPATKTTTRLAPAADANAPAGNGNQTPAKATVKKKAANAAPKKTPARKPVGFSTEDIALRAYFISENRHRHGLSGDSQSDWIEAERQLRAEHRKKPAKKLTPSKKRA